MYFINFRFESVASVADVDGGAEACLSAGAVMGAHAHRVKGDGSTGHGLFLGGCRHVGLARRAKGFPRFEYILLDLLSCHF